MVKIQSVKLFKLAMPLSKPFITNIRASTSLHSLIYQVVLEDGSNGYGESAENYKLTGESLTDMIDYSKKAISTIKGMDADSALTSIVNAEHYHSAKYGIEMALVDAIARSNGESVNSYLNIDAATRPLYNDTTISIMDEISTRNATSATVQAGYKCIKYKVKSGTEELNRILSVADLLSDDVSIRIDPNQAWSRQESISNIGKLQDSGIKVDFIEQPVKVDDLDGMKEITRFSRIPIVADESVFGLNDAKKVIDEGYADLINIKLIKCGGPIEAIRIANFAKEKGIGCLFGCTSEVNISLNMAACLSAGLSNVHFIDLDGLDYVDNTPFSGGIHTDNGLTYIPQAMGLGIDAETSSEYLNPIIG